MRVNQIFLRLTCSNYLVSNLINKKYCLCFFLITIYFKGTVRGQNWFYHFRLITWPIFLKEKNPKRETKWNIRCLFLVCVNKTDPLMFRFMFKMNLIVSEIASSSIKFSCPSETRRIFKQVKAIRMKIQLFGYMNFMWTHSEIHIALT